MLMATDRLEEGLRQTLAGKQDYETQNSQPIAEVPCGSGQKEIEGVTKEAAQVIASRAVTV